MVTIVLTEDVQEVEVEPDNGRVNAVQWHYHIPCAGVKYYSFEPPPPSVDEIDPWALGEPATTT